MEQIIRAERKDIHSLIQLVNSAYRGEGSKKGWTTEADLISGDTRVDERSLEEMLNDTSAVILTYRNDNVLQGCVYLQKQENDLYLGMFAVDPNIQGGGIGKKLLKAAEEHARAFQCNAIVMTVISVRSELIAWYERNGYADTGKRKPFPDEKKFGEPTQPLTFVVLKKPLQ